MIDARSFTSTLAHTHRRPAEWARVAMIEAGFIQVNKLSLSPRLFPKGFQGLQRRCFRRFGTLAQVPRQTHEVKSRGRRVMAKTFQMQHGAPRRRPGKIGGTHGQWRICPGTLECRCSIRRFQPAVWLRLIYFQASYAKYTTRQGGQWLWGEHPIAR